MPAPFSGEMGTAGGQPSSSDRSSMLYAPLLSSFSAVRLQAGRPGGQHTAGAGGQWPRCTGTVPPSSLPCTCLSSLPAAAAGRHAAPNPPLGSPMHHLPTPASARHLLPSSRPQPRPLWCLRGCGLPVQDGEVEAGGGGARGDETVAVGDLGRPAGAASWQLSAFQERLCPMRHIWHLPVTGNTPRLMWRPASCDPRSPQRRLPIGRGWWARGRGEGLVLLRLWQVAAAAGGWHVHAANSCGSAAAAQGATPALNFLWRLHPCCSLQPSAGSTPPVAVILVLFCCPGAGFIQLRAVCPQQAA